MPSRDAPSPEVPPSEESVPAVELTPGPSNDPLLEASQTGQTSQPALPGQPAGASRRGVFPVSPALAYGGAIACGLLYWLAFPGRLPLGSWHGLLALVAFVPLWLALQGQPPKRAMWVGVLAGTTMNVAGFTWLLDMLETFSGFPGYICFFFVLVVCAYQGGRLGLMGWLYARATARQWPAALVFVVAFIASELAYPLLFPWYFAATTYQLPALSQTAELGGPILVGAILVGVNIALAEPLLARLERRPIIVSRLVLPLVVLAAAIVFAAVRIPVVDRVAQAGEAMHVGVVQGNMGLIQKREDPAEGLRRHLQLTGDLKAKGVDVVVWSESSVTIAYPESRYAAAMKEQFTRGIGMPAIIGAVLFADTGLQQSLYNTALSVDARGEVTGRYDKEFLLAFGEYLPFGELIPKLYEWSPNSGRFTPGTIVDPLPVTLDGMTHPVSVLICYEDILPSFTNKAVRHAQPELLVNMSNDAWFGDTAEPWEHLALAQLRAIEHRRYLVRSTNSGVSAIVDPVGRVMVHGGTFDAEAIDAIVHWQHGSTLYESLGDAPWYVLTGLLFVAAFVRRGKLGARGVLAAHATMLSGALALCVSALAGLTGCSSNGSSPGDASTRDGAHADVQASDASDATAPSPGVDAGPCPVIQNVVFNSFTCKTCVADRCCAQATACYTPAVGGGVPACATLAECFSTCAGAFGDAGDGPDGQAGCNSKCEANADGTEGAYAALQSCLADRCTNDAGTAPCDVPDGGPVAP